MFGRGKEKYGMSYNGKKIVRIIGRIISGVGTVILQYADGTVEIVS